MKKIDIYIIHQFVALLGTSLLGFIVIFLVVDAVENMDKFIDAEVLETSELISKSIKESNLPKEIRIGAVVRKKEVIIPKSDFVFEKKDLVVFLTKREHLEKVESLFRISSLV